MNLSLMVPLQFYYRFYCSMILIGIFGFFASFCLAVMKYNGTEGIELATALSVVALFGLARSLMPCWSTAIGEEDLYFSIASNFRNKKNASTPTLLSELAVDTRVLGNGKKEDENALFLHHELRNSPCSICLQSYETGQDLAVVCACKHTYHSKCLQKWIQKNTTCPYCRQDMEKASLRESNRQRQKLSGAPGVIDGTFDSVFD